MKSPFRKENTAPRRRRISPCGSLASRPSSRPTSTCCQALCAGRPAANTPAGACTGAQPPAAKRRRRTGLGPHGHQCFVALASVGGGVTRVVRHIIQAAAKYSAASKAKKRHSHTAETVSSVPVLAPVLNAPHCRFSRALRGVLSSRDYHASDARSGGGE